VAVQGFVQTVPTAAEVDGHPVRSWAELSEADRCQALLIGIFNRDTPFDGLVQLATDAGCQRVLLPWDFYGQFKPQLGWRYWLADPALLQAHAADLTRIHTRLADDASRECLRRLVAFRLGQGLGYAGFTHDEPQYFNALTLRALPAAGVRYLDGGAYNGDSFRELVAAAPVSQAWLFEPDPANYAQLAAQVREARWPGLCLPLALSDRYGILRFSSGLGEAGHLDAHGDEAIATVAIDELLAGQGVDFIKLDVEGAEVAALRGAANTLRAHRPVLALSCYHRPEDLWQLSDLLDELAPGYRLYLRQHTRNSFDLVLYAVPP
jgi:FkbM family methyltransferase